MLALLEVRQAYQATSGLFPFLHVPLLRFVFACEKVPLSQRKGLRERRVRGRQKWSGSIMGEERDMWSSYLFVQIFRSYLRGAVRGSPDQMAPGGIGISCGGKYFPKEDDKIVYKKNDKSNLKKW